MMSIEVIAIIVAFGTALYAVVYSTYEMMQEKK
jgi:hypothetical protein